MGKKPWFDNKGLKKGAWSSEEDELLVRFVKLHGHGKWSSLAQKAGLNRSGKSCRLRWLNYLRPGIKRGDFSTDEEELIIRLHRLLGNRWALIAGRLPGRTDNEIKNYWNTILMKKIQGQRTGSIRQCQYSEDKKDVEEFSPGFQQIQEQELAKDENVGPRGGQSTGTHCMHIQDSNKSLTSDAFNVDSWQENESPSDLESGQKMIDQQLQHLELRKIASLLDIENELRGLL